MRDLYTVVGREDAEAFLDDVRADDEDLAARFASSPSTWTA